jgi:hypothetical protein
MKDNKWKNRKVEKSVEIYGSLLGDLFWDKAVRISAQGMGRSPMLHKAIPWLLPQVPKGNGR